MHLELTPFRFCPSFLLLLLSMCRLVQFIPVGLLSSPMLQSIRHCAHNLADGILEAKSQEFETVGHMSDNVTGASFALGVVSPGLAPLLSGHAPLVLEFVLCLGNMGRGRCLSHRLRSDGVCHFCRVGVRKIVVVCGFVFSRFDVVTFVFVPKIHGNVRVRWLKVVVLKIIVVDYVFILYKFGNSRGSAILHPEETLLYIYILLRASPGIPSFLKLQNACLCLG